MNYFAYDNIHVLCTALPYDILANVLAQRGVFTSTLEKNIQEKRVEASSESHASTKSRLAGTNRVITQRGALAWKLYENWF